MLSSTCNQKRKTESGKPGFYRHVSAHFGFPFSVFRFPILDHVVR